MTWAMTAVSVGTAAYGAVNAHQGNGPAPQAPQLAAPMYPGSVSTGYGGWTIDPVTGRQVYSQNQDISGSASSQFRNQALQSLMLGQGGSGAMQDLEAKIQAAQAQVDRYKTGGTNAGNPIALTDFLKDPNWVGADGKAINPSSATPENAPGLYKQFQTLTAAHNGTYGSGGNDFARWAQDAYNAGPKAKIEEYQNALKTGKGNDQTNQEALTNAQTQLDQLMQLKQNSASTVSGLQNNPLQQYLQSSGAQMFGNAPAPGTGQPTGFSWDGSQTPFSMQGDTNMPWLNSLKAGDQAKLGQTPTLPFSTQQGWTPDGGPGTFQGASALQSPTAFQGKIYDPGSPYQATPKFEGASAFGTPNRFTGEIFDPSNASGTGGYGSGLGFKQAAGAAGGQEKIQANAVDPTAGGKLSQMMAAQAADQFHSAIVQRQNLMASRGMSNSSAADLANAGSALSFANMNNQASLSGAQYQQQLNDSNFSQRAAAQAGNNNAQQTWFNNLMGLENAGYGQNLQTYNTRQSNAMGVNQLNYNQALGAHQVQASDLLNNNSQQYAQNLQNYQTMLGAGLQTYNTQQNNAMNVNQLNFGQGLQAHNTQQSDLLNNNTQQYNQAFQNDQAGYSRMNNEFNLQQQLRDKWRAQALQSLGATNAQETQDWSRSLQGDQYNRANAQTNYNNTLAGLNYTTGQNQLALAQQTGLGSLYNQQLGMGQGVGTQISGATTAQQTAQAGLNWQQQNAQYQGGIQQRQAESQSIGQLGRALGMAAQNYQPKPPSSTPQPTYQPSTLQPYQQPTPTVTPTWTPWK